MPVTTTTESLSELHADAIVVGVHADASPTGSAAAFDRASGGLLTRLLEAKEITGKKCETVTLLGPRGVKAGPIRLAGLGHKDGFDRAAAFRAASTASKTLAAKERGRAAFCRADNWPSDFVEAAVCGSVVGCLGQDLYRVKKNRFPLGEIVWGGV